MIKSKVSGMWALFGHSSTFEWYTTMLGVNGQRHEQIRGGTVADPFFKPPVNKIPMTKKKPHIQIIDYITVSSQSHVCIH